jgi:hypothetical protein
MKNLLVLGILLSLAVAAPLIAGQTCKPVAGHFEAHVVPPGGGDNNFCPNNPDQFCTAGRVWGGIQGNYQFIMTAALPSATIGGVPTILFFTGQSTIFLHDGGQVQGTDTGSIDLPPGQGGFASLITFTSGATGQIRLRGEFDPAAGTTAGDYAGQVCAE